MQISKLKNIELINTKQKSTTNLYCSTTAVTNITSNASNKTNNQKILNESNTNANQQLKSNPIHKQLKQLEIPDNVINQQQQQQQISHKNEQQQLQQQQQQENYINLLTTKPFLLKSLPTTTKTTIQSEANTRTSIITMPPTDSIAALAAEQQEFEEEEKKINEELTKHLENNNKAIQNATNSIETDLVDHLNQHNHHHHGIHNSGHHHHHHHHHHHLLQHHHNSNSSDTDSALSSAPTSISPQPPANGMEPSDIWQTVSKLKYEIMQCKIRQQTNLLINNALVA